MHTLACFDGVSPLAAMYVEAMVLILIMCSLNFGSSNNWAPKPKKILLWPHVINFLLPNNTPHNVIKPAYRIIIGNHFI